MNSYWKFQPPIVNHSKTLYVKGLINLNLLAKFKSVEQFRSFRQSAIITVYYQSNKPQLINMHSWFKFKIYMHNSKCTRPASCVNMPDKTILFSGALRQPADLRSLQVKLNHWFLTNLLRALAMRRWVLQKLKFTVTAFAPENTVNVSLIMRIAMDWK